MFFNVASIERITATADGINHFLRNELSLNCETQRAEQLEKLHLSEHRSKKFLHMYYRDPQKISSLKLHVPIRNTEDIVLIASAIDALGLEMIMGLKFVNLNYVTTSRSMYQVPITIYFVNSVSAEDISIAIFYIDSVIEEMVNRFSLEISGVPIAESDQKISKYCSITMGHVNGEYISAADEGAIDLRHNALSNSPLYADVKKLVPLGSILDNINIYIRLQQTKRSQEHPLLKDLFRRVFYGFTSQDKIRAAHTLKNSLVTAVNENNDLLNVFLQLSQREASLNHGRLGLIFGECFNFLKKHDETSPDTPPMLQR